MHSLAPSGQGPKAHTNSTRKNRNVKYYPQIKWFGCTSMASLLWTMSGALRYLSLTLRTLLYYGPKRTHPFFTRQEAGDIAACCFSGFVMCGKQDLSLVRPCPAPHAGYRSCAAGMPELHGSGWQHGTAASCTSPGLTTPLCIWGLQVLPVLLQSKENSTQSIAGSPLAPFEDSVCSIAP